VHRQLSLPHNQYPYRIMKQHSSSFPTMGHYSIPASLLSFPVLGGALLIAGLVSGCGGSPALFGSAAAPTGETVPHFDSGIGSETFVVDGNHGGQASEVKVTNIYWGRLVDVMDGWIDANGEVHAISIQNRDMVIGEGIFDGQDFYHETGKVRYALARNAVTERWTVTIGAAAGTTEYTEAFLNLDKNLTPTLEASLEASEMGPFSMTPRNSAMVIFFDDLLNPRFVRNSDPAQAGEWQDSFGGNLINSISGQLNSQVVKVRTGYPPVDPFEARVILDKNHGDWADLDNNGEVEFYSTRIIIGTTVTEIESAASNPPLPVNSVGLPPSIDTIDANLAVRIPTLLDPAVGQTQLLVNPSGSRVTFGEGGWQDPASSTLDLVRALRSGGDEMVTGDQHNGFLVDEVPPEILGDFPLNIIASPEPVDGTSDQFVLPEWDFSLLECNITPRVGDVVTQGEVKAEVLSVIPGQLDGMTVRVIVPVGGTLLPGNAQYLTPYDPNQEGLRKCFVRFSPSNSDLNASPNEDVSSAAQVVVRFSKPMDPSTLSPYDTFTITRESVEPVPYEYVIGRVLPSPDLRVFTWSHTGVPFDNFKDTGELDPDFLEYYINLASGGDGPTDLAGNTLSASFEQVQFTLDRSGGTEKNAGLALRFHTDDEYGVITDDNPRGGPDELPDLRNGQLLFDFLQERILPRPVSRFDVAADRNQPVPSVMAPFVGGIQTPLSNLGSKLHMVWRYCDLGFSLTDETNMNVDVEGLSWAPVGGSVITDTYDEFSVTVAHSAWVPDEVLDTNSGFPKYPGSGLKQTYETNFLDLEEDPARVVHSRDLGYTVNPANLYTASSKTLMLPFPWNEDKMLDDYTFYTWRDTAILALGGLQGGGVPLGQEGVVSGGGGGGMPVYMAGSVPTIGLPLLMEFRCYPDDVALGLNAFDISLACNSSARPNFRAFSTGGYNTDGSQNVKNPDTEDEASGGISPATGNATPPVDCSFYIGEMSLVTRISRVHTVWLDSRIVDPTYMEPIVEPGPDEQPSGTQVVFAYRGATDITGQNAGPPPDDIRSNANRLDFYGDTHPTGGGNSSALFLNGDNSWKSDISEINSARYFQVRISFISNAVSYKTAELRTVAFAWRDLNV
jgi:hypothetical protein